MDFRYKTSQTLVNLAKPDPEQLQKLQALGYVGSDTDPAQDQKMLSGVDPKARIEISNLLHDAMFDVEDARYEQAIPFWRRRSRCNRTCRWQICSMDWLRLA